MILAKNNQNWQFCRFFRRYCYSMTLHLSVYLSIYKFFDLKFYKSQFYIELFHFSKRTLSRRNVVYLPEHAIVIINKKDKYNIIRAQNLRKICYTTCGCCNLCLYIFFQFLTVKNMK